MQLFEVITVMDFATRLWLSSLPWNKASAMTSAH